jgi:hypothetical protein
MTKLTEVMPQGTAQELVPTVVKTASDEDAAEQLSGGAVAVSPGICTRIAYVDANATFRAASSAIAVAHRTNFRWFEFIFCSE